MLRRILIVALLQLLLISLLSVSLAQTQSVDYMTEINSMKTIIANQQDTIDQLSLKVSQFSTDALVESAKNRETFWEIIIVILSILIAIGGIVIPFYTDIKTRVLMSKSKEINRALKQQKQEIINMYRGMASLAQDNTWASKHEYAINFYRKIIEILPNDDISYYQATQCYLCKKPSQPNDIDDALFLLRKGLEKNKKSALINAAISQVAAKKPDAESYFVHFYEYYR